MTSLRPSDLAREHGLSAQAVRNYERDGFLPPAERTDSGYRVYTELHAAALRAFLALVPAYGHGAAGRIMRALHGGALDEALTLVDHGHSRLLRDRETLEAVRDALGRLTTEHAEHAGHAEPTGPGAHRPWSVGELARHLEVTPATLRKWEEAGILAPARDPATGYRVFRADDVRDAELAHLLRRGGRPLDHIATVVRRIRTAGGAEALTSSLDDWQHRLTARGVAMLNAATHVSRYLTLLDLPAPPSTASAPSAAGPQHS
ncbi:TioE family transcriptional regulator [Streptomyces neyagawaensis]|uniref:TioE family transcriptional regulator n=1 Tax=Streptomyces neyagawaensis TaxID=42238 RepID=UPI0006E227FB|nr:TioE family transcriptional regulator [Streptomyces neyagawaensis]MCL6736691.1 TioE family transcriptional regulator [Streptomyces neyagawaensis]MDE1684956.1 TioE family transcriptional regulator [Streptomyces neyagawaensis]